MKIFFSRLRVGGGNQIPRLHFQKHLTKRYPSYLLHFLVSQHHVMLDFSVEIKFADFVDRLPSAACSLKKLNTAKPMVQKQTIIHQVRSDQHRTVTFVFIKIKFQ